MGNNKWQRFESQAKNGKITWWQMDLPSGNVRFGEAKTKMLGYSHDDFIYYQDFTNILHPDDYEKAMQDMRDHLEGRKDYYETTYRIKSKSGEYITFFDIGKVVSRDGENITAHGFVFKVEDENDADYYSDLVKNQISDFSEILLRIID